MSETDKRITRVKKHPRFNMLQNKFKIKSKKFKVVLHFTLLPFLKQNIKTLRNTWP